MPVIMLISLNSCADRMATPSLLPRPIEANRPDDVAVSPSPVQADPAEAEMISKLLDQARLANDKFDQALLAVTKSGSPGSEMWIKAESARSVAEIARAPGLDALTALDAAMARAIDSGRNPDTFMSARREVQAMADRQAAQLEALSR